jgi:Peptidase_C39 like family
MRTRLHLLILLAAVAVTGCKTISPMTKNQFASFKGLDDFANFASSTNASGETVLLSPPIKAGMDWNELIVSWNADAPTGTLVKVEVQAIAPAHTTKFYTMGLWSPDNLAFPRTSVRHQKDADGDVKTDTLELSQFADAAQLRVTLGGTNGALPTLKFLGLSFSNTKVTPPVLEPDREAWGKIIPTPEKSQNAYPEEEGWCSPTSLTMVLERWASVLNRTEMNLDVPQVADAVYDDAYHGTGNWPFNTAFAGSFNGMRAYVTRFNGISELEQWINAGIPVIISAPWGMLDPTRISTGNGHLTVCIGFTKDGDVVDNDPGTNPKKSVRHIYKRENVIRAWATSYNTVYLVYPISAKIPSDQFGQW